ncbi:hypothetical protein HW932_15400 [Allochromatium humboldtianum]|uniref:Uncharacterized protein n=1 Tax=Allochromatium humboldtianum TaxID=504901 RepID=A0A850RBF0_9GAMM|nr:hypothetical protein [Allochromatium humboldtianum]NVZ10648.1 hypothetical protein [Allochromatium humboldtianum]
MRKHIRYPRLHELSATAAEEFERLLKSALAGLWHLPDQHRPTAEQALTEAGLDPAYAIRGRGFEIAVWRSLLGEPDYEVRWIGFDEIESQFPDDVVAAAKLLHLLKFIQDRAHREGIANTPELSWFLIKQEVLRYFWIAFVVPELHAEGVTLKQSARRSGGPDVRVFALRLQRSGLSRAQARDRLMERFDFGKRRAYAILEDVWGPALGRKKPEKR